MLNFAAMFLCCFCCFHKACSAPIIKASGVQWSEPRGTGKGNLTLLMIPQNNSCTNDTDMIVAIKSDYQVLSQDTQLLNLIINEYQNDTLNESKCLENVNQDKKVNPSKPVGSLGQEFKTDQTNVCTANNITGSELSLSINENKKNDGTLNDSKCDENENNSNKTTSKPTGSINQDCKLDQLPGIVNTNQNNTDKDFALNSSTSPNTVKHLSISISNGYQKPEEKQSTCVFNGGLGDKDFNKDRAKDSRVTDSTSYADFLKFLNLGGEVEQHSEIDPLKVPHNANFYEVDKKLLPQEVKNQSDLFGYISHKNYVGSKESHSTLNGNAANIFKFFNSAQAREITSSTQNSILNMFKLLAVTEPSHVTPPSTKSFSTVNIFKLLNITDPNEITSSNNTNNKNYKSPLFNDKEINIFKMLNISEPNTENKLKKLNERNIIDSTPSILISDENILDETIHIMNKLNQEHPHGDSNLRNNVLPGNEIEELVAQEEGDSDTKSKNVKDDSSALASDKEDFQKRELEYSSLNQIDRSNVEGFSGSNSENGSEIVTACLLVKENGNNLLSTTPNFNLNSHNAKPTALPQGAKANTAATLTTVSPSCRTSIIYICNPEKVTGAFEQISKEVEEKLSEVNKSKPKSAMQGSQKKITLAPQINCEELLRTKQISGYTTTGASISQNEESHLESKYIYPLVESSLFLANNNEMPKEKNLPVLLNTSSDNMNLADSYRNYHNKNLARLYNDPSDSPINEEMSDHIPLQINKTKNIIKKKIITIKNSKLKDNENIYHPGQIIKMRFAGKNIVLEQMPSYRSEKFNKNCGDTRSSEPPNDEMEPDDAENQVLSRTKSPKKTTSITKPSDITNNKIIEKEESKEEESYTKVGTTPEKPEGNEITVSQISSKLRTKKFERTSKTEGKETTSYITECKTVNVIKNTEPIEKPTARQDSKESCITLWTDNQNEDQMESVTTSTATKSGITIFGDENSLQSSSTVSKLRNELDQSTTDSYLMTDIVAKGTIKSKTSTNNVEDKVTSDDTYSASAISRSKTITTKSFYNDFGISITAKPHLSTESKDQNKTCEKNLFIPGESVKEIVIQIIRNTKKPERNINTKSCYNYREDLQSDLLANEFSHKNHNFQQGLELSNERTKSGDFELGVNDVENNQQQNMNYPKLYKKIENVDEIISLNTNTGKSKLDKPSISLANNNKKSFPYSDLKLFADDNNAINGV